MTNKKYKKPSEENEAGDPAVPYHPATGNKSIRFFSTFEEMNEADVREMAGLTPMQRFEHVTYLLQHFYSEELSKPISDFRLHFK